jgi:large subunit ribosomal protein L13
MDTLSYKTRMLRKEDAKPGWIVIDATGKPLGRLASRVAYYLQGKHKPSYTPHVMCGDHVIVINAEKVVLTGKKWEKKIYQFYSGYPGGERRIPAIRIYQKDPRRLMELAVRRMLPKNRLGRKLFSRLLHVYVGEEHPFRNHKPNVISLSR